MPLPVRRFGWLGRVGAQARIALGVFLVALVAQYAALNYAMERNRTLMREIVEQNQAATKAIDALSEDLAALSYRILGVVGGIYAAPSIANELPKLGTRITSSWDDVRTRLIDHADAETTRRAEAAIAALPGFIDETRALFLRTTTAPSDAERMRLERHHDKWLDIRPSLTVYTESARQHVAEHAAQSYEALKRLETRLSLLAGVALAGGLVALGLTWYLILFLIARPVTSLVAAMRRIATGDTSAPVPNLDHRSEVGDMARAVQVFKEKSIENQRLHEEEARRGVELARARDEAQMASRTKSEFLANMSHELRTPLNAIIGFSEVMLAQLYGPIGNARYVEYAKDIHQSGRHLLEIINDILDIAKVEAGKLELRLERVAIADVFSACRRLMQERAAAAGVTLVIESPGAVSEIVADEIRLRQILLNLLSNAIKFTPRGGQVSLRVERTATAQCKFHITDTGIGMTEQELALAVQPFTQIDNTLARRYDGTGLGLPLTRALVELHGGSLLLDSRPGYGTTATVALPLVPKAEAGDLDTSMPPTVIGRRAAGAT